MSTQQSKSDGVARGHKEDGKKASIGTSSREKFARMLEANKDIEETNEIKRRKAEKKFNSVSELMKAHKEKRK